MIYVAKGRPVKKGSGTERKAWIILDSMVVGEITVDHFDVRWSTYDSGITSALADYLAGRFINAQSDKANELLSFILLHRAFGKVMAVGASRTFRDRMKPVFDGGRRRWTREALFAEALEARVKP